MRIKYTTFSAHQMQRVLDTMSIEVFGRTLKGVGEFQANQDPRHPHVLFTPLQTPGLPQHECRAIPFSNARIIFGFTSGKSSFISEYFRSCCADAHEPWDVL